MGFGLFFVLLFGSTLIKKGYAALRKTSKKYLILNNVKAKPAFQKF
jgi:hypothetical protein